MITIGENNNYVTKIGSYIKKKYTVNTFFFTLFVFSLIRKTSCQVSFEEACGVKKKTTRRIARASVLVSSTYLSVVFFFVRPRCVNVRVIMSRKLISKRISVKAINLKAFEHIALFDKHCMNSFLRQYTKTGV